MNAIAPVRAFTDPILGFAGPPIVVGRTGRETLADLIALVPLEHEVLRQHLRIKADGVIIDPSLYRLVMPKVDAQFAIVLPVQGGKNSLLGTLAVAALVGASIFVGGGGLLGTLGPSFASGALGANLVAGGLSLAASLLLQGLNTPAAADNSDAKEIGVASAQNAFEPGAYLQRVLGTRKVTPQMVMPPFTQLDGDDQLVTAVYGLSGPHQIGEIKVGSAEIEGAADIEYEVREGFSGDAALTLVSDTRIEVPLSLKLSQFRMKSASEATNAVDTSIAPYVPQWHRVETKIAPDRVKLFLTFDQGLIYAGPSGAGPAITAVRARIRRKGAPSWYNLPEFVLRGEKQSGALRVFLDFRWLAPGSMPGSVTGFTANYGGFSWLYKSVEDADPTVYWSADNYFASNKIDWINKQQVKVYLNTDVFPQDAAYEIEVIRGFSASKAAFTATSSTIHTISENSVTLYDFFGTIVATGETRVPNAQSYFADALSIPAVQSIWNEYPFDFTDQPTAVIAIRARNRSLDQVTCIASGYVADWNGSTWVADQVSSNPASWYREVLRGELNAEPVADSLLDLENLQDWHGWCASEDWAVNAIVQGQPVSEVLSIIAQAGMARPRYGATHGVVIDRPREPVHMITQRNAGGFGFSKPFGRLPHALKVNLSDETRDYEVREVIVYADGYNADGSGGLTEASRFESISYAGLTSEALVTRRAARDMAFGRYRSRLITFTVDIEHLAYTLGDLVLLETDILGQESGRGRVKSITYAGGLVSGLVLDEERDFTKADAGLTGLRWDFASGDEGFTVVNGSASAAGGVLEVTASTADCIIEGPNGVSIDGATYTTIKVRVRRVSGSGVWQGQAFYNTSGHGYSGSFMKVVAAPADPSAWSVVEFDMSNLTAGGSDWVSSVITRIRLDLWGNGDVFEVDSVELWGPIERGVAIRLADGDIRFEKVTGDDADRNAVTFATPFAMPTDAEGDLIVPGTLVASGGWGQEARKVLIWDIAPGPDLTAQITAIDYAETAIYGAPGFTTGFSLGFRS